MDIGRWKESKKMEEKMKSTRFRGKYVFIPSWSRGEWAGNMAEVGWHTSCLGAETAMRGAEGYIASWRRQRAEQNEW